MSQKLEDRAADARRRAAETKNQRTKMKIFGSAVRQASGPRRQQQITVVSICKEARVSSTAFYYHFENGVPQLLGELLDRSVQHIKRRIADDVRRENPDPNYRVAIAVYRLVEELFRYPNMFEIESVPRKWVQALAMPLADAVVAGRPTDPEDAWAIENHPAMVIAEYHANAIVGLLRNDYTPSFEFFAKLVTSQIIPVLGMADSEFADRWQNLIHSMPRI